MKKDKTHPESRDLLTPTINNDKIYTMMVIVSKTQRELL
jgi:hypothetical protein